MKEVSKPLFFAIKYTDWYIVCIFAQSNSILKKSDKTRAFIIERASVLFNKKGYAGTSMADLTQATGLTKGAIYGNFENKDEVATAVFEYNISLIADGLKRVMEAENNADSRLRAMVHFYRDHFEKVVERGGCPMLNTAVEADDCFPEMKNRAAATLISWQDSIIRTIQWGKENGIFKPEADAKQFATICMALIEGGIMLAKALNERKRLDDALNQIDRIIDQDLKV